MSNHKQATNKRLNVPSLAHAGKASPENIEKMANNFMASYDENHDGVVDFEEFLAKIKM